MANPVVVDFILRGMPDVARALKTVEQAAAASDRARIGAVQRGSQQRTRVEDQEAKAKVRAMIKADAEVKRIQDRAYRDVERMARAKVRSEERAEQQIVKAAEKSANEKLRIARQVDREVGAIEKRRARDNERILREGRRLEEQTHRQQSRAVERRGREKDRFNRGIADGVMGAGRAAAGIAGRVAGTFGQLGGGFTIADAVEREVGLNRQAGKIAASTVADEKGNKPVTRDILASARATGIESAIDPKEILEGIDQFKNLTGDTNRAMKLMPDIAKLATAFGAETGELAQNAGNIAISLGEKGTNEDVMKMLRIQTRQGAVGSVELADMAKFGGRLTAGASLFEGDRAENIAKMGAFSQVARASGGAATPAEAAMAAQRFATDVASHADSLSGMGIDVKGKDGKLKDSTSILKQMLEKTGGDVTKFKETGLGERGVKVLTGFADIYGKAGGGKKGMEAVDKELKKYTEGIAQSEVEMRARERMQDADKKLELAMIELRSAVGNQLLPEFMKMVPVLQEAMPTIRKLLSGLTTLADWALGNPLAGLSAIMGAAFAKELAIASIGKLMQSALSSSLATGGLAIGGAVMTIAMAKMMIEEEFKKEAGDQKTAVERQLEATNLMTKINRGEATPEDLKKAQDLMTDLGVDRSKQVDARENPGFWKTASGAAANVVAPEAAKEAALAEEHNRQQTITDLNTTMKLLKTAIEHNTTATKSDGKKDVPGGGPGGKPAAASTGIVQRAVQ